MNKGLWLSLVRLANKHTKNLRTFRRMAIWSYSTIVRANIFLLGPRVLLNGPTKSGTHLLGDCLSLMPKMVYSGRHFALADFFARPHKRWDVQFYYSKPRPAVDSQRLQRFLELCRQGMFVTAHASFHPRLQKLIEELHFKHIFLIRDPRDMVVSYAFFSLCVSPGIITTSTT